MSLKANAITAAKRWDICSSCEHLTKLTKQCKLCYCFMKLKIHVSDAECPDNPKKWLKEGKKESKK